LAENRLSIFSDSLRELRKTKNLTQRELGDILGIGQTTVANYEQGARFPDSEMLVKIADFFTVSLDFLLGREQAQYISVNNSTGFRVSEGNTHTTVTPSLIAGLGTPGNSPTQTSTAPSGGVDQNNSDSTTIKTLSQDLIKSIIEGNPGYGSDIILEYAQSRKRIQDTYQYILEPVLHQIGDLWEQGRVDIYTEHLASQTIRNIMANLRTRIAQREKKNLRFLGMAASGELHDIGLQMATDFLYMDGWDTFFLGTYLPTQETLKAILSYNPQVLGISVTIHHHLDSAANLISFLKSHLTDPKGLKVIVGGRAFVNQGDVWKTIGADGYAQNAQHTVELANSLIAPHYQ
jgi:methanogenic corrinoid protein MtbC1/DNA-binding XRE family transcriptional regulator